MRFPITAQALDHRRGNRHFAVLPALPIDDPDDGASAIDIRRAKPDRFANAQAAVMDQGENGPEAALANRTEQAPGLFTGQHDRQRVIAPDLELLPELPVALEEVLIKQPQGNHCLVERGGSQLLLVAPEDQVIKDLPLSQL